MDTYFLGITFYTSKMGLYGETAMLLKPIRMDSMQFETMLMLFYF